MTGVDLVCLGEPMMEFNQQPTGPDGRRLFLEGLGGDTSNAAVAAARQGARVAYVTALGDDLAGDRFEAFWRAEGIDTGGVARSALHPTAIYFVSHGPKGHEFTYFRRGSAASHLRPADIPTETVAGARMLYASGISQGISDTAADAVFHAIAVAREHGVAVAYDTNYRPRLWPAARAAAVIHAAIAQADVALPGLEDAAQLTGLTDPDDVADFYLRLGPRVVVLKMGAEGALLATPESRLRVAAHPAEFVDATGAGDTFCGSFLARLCKGDTPERAVRYASVAAALKCRGYGAVTPIPHAPEVEAALAALAGHEPVPGAAASPP